MMKINNNFLMLMKHDVKEFQTPTAIVVDFFTEGVLCTSDGYDNLNGTEMLDENPYVEL